MNNIRGGDNLENNIWLIKAEESLSKLEYPNSDNYELPSSNSTFADGANYRVEISGVEKPSTLETLIEQKEISGVNVHRVIISLMGSTWLTGEDLTRIAQLSKEANLEVIMAPGQRPLWEIGKQSSSPEGCLSGLRLRGQDSVKFYLADIFRCVEKGIRGFLVWDEGVLKILNELRQMGELPKETIFKVSILAGHGNAAGAKLLHELGANSFNPVNDVTTPMLAGIRQYCDLPMDIHVVNFDSFGGQTRFWEMPEIIRVASPCYIKFEPGPSIAQMARPWLSEESLSYSIRQKVRQVKTVVEIIEGKYPNLKQSEQNCEDLVVANP